MTAYGHVLPFAVTESAPIDVSHQKDTLPSLSSVLITKKIIQHIRQHNGSESEMLFQYVITSDTGAAVGSRG